MFPHIRNYFKNCILKYLENYEWFQHKEMIHAGDYLTTIHTYPRLHVYTRFCMSVSAQVHTRM